MKGDKYFHKIVSMVRLVDRVPAIASKMAKLKINIIKSHKNNVYLLCSIPEMRIWSILLIKSDLKWCIHLSRSLYLYLYKIDKTGPG